MNAGIIETRMKMSMTRYLEQCISAINDLNNSKLLMGLGELMDEKMKHFVRSKLKSETLELLKFYHKYPILDPV